MIGLIHGYNRTSVAEILKICIVICWIVWAAAYSLNTAINIPTFHLDGAFQTASSLYRIHAGQLPGRDFFPYLGIGPVFILYPAFVLFGANISASVVAAQFMVLVLGMVSVSLICRFLWRPASFSTALVVGCCVFLAPIALYSIITSTNMPGMSIAVLPGQSLRPLRCTAPYVVALVLYAFIFRLIHERVKYLAAGTLAGMLLLWSNDFALPTVVLLCFPLYFHARARHEVCTSNVLCFICASAVIWILLLVFATGGVPLAMLHYNFMDVTRDQWWYFGPYTENARIFSFADVGKLFSQSHHNPWRIWPFCLLVFFSTAGLAYKSRLAEHGLLLWIGTTLFAGGVVATVGGIILMVFSFGDLSQHFSVFRACYGFVLVVHFFRDDIMLPCMHLLRSHCV